MFPVPMFPITLFCRVLLHVVPPKQTECCIGIKTMGAWGALRIAVGLPTHPRAGLVTQC